MLIDCKNKACKEINFDSRRVLLQPCRNKMKELKPQINIIILMMYPLSSLFTPLLRLTPIARAAKAGLNSKRIILFNESRN